MRNRKPKHFELGNRERQLAEVVYRLGEASVAEVLDEIADKPNYSTVRTILNKLVRKKILAVRRDGVRFLYRSVTPRETVQHRAMHEVVDSLFSGSPLDAIVALLDDSVEKLSDADFNRLEEIIKKARKEGR